MVPGTYSTFTITTIFTESPTSGHKGHLSCSKPHAPPSCGWIIIQLVLLTDIFIVSHLVRLQTMLDQQLRSCHLVHTQI